MVKNCPNVLSSGTCSDSNCAYNHNVYNCPTCGILLPSINAYTAHTRSKKHLRRVSQTTAGEPGWDTTFCTLCEVNIPGGQWQQHISGRKHHSNATRQGVSADTLPAEARETSTTLPCDICHCSVMARMWQSHINGSRHKSRAQFSSYQRALQNAEMDRGNVAITGDFDFHFVDPATAQAGVRREATIAVSEANTRVLLRDVRLASLQGSTGSTNPGFSVTLTPSSTPITNLRPTRFHLSFRNAFIGRYEDRLELTFEDARLKQSFVIIRVLKAIVGDQTLHQQLQPRAPYVPRVRTQRQVVRETDVVPGEKPPAQTAVRYIGGLPKAMIPDYLQRVLDNDTFSTSKTVQEVQKSMPTTFDSGDRILVQEQGSTNGKWYEGHVHVVRQLEVGLCFHMNFGVHHSPNKRFHVRFKLNRIPVRRQHQALDTMFTPSRLFFPSHADLEHLVAQRPAEVPLRLFNKLIETNEPQLRAVAGVVTMQPGAMPFIIFGPPGTGKTITIIECIQQVLAANPQARVFACAPSNSAADLIALRLTDRTVFGDAALSKEQLFRFYAPSRAKSQCPDKLLDFTCTTPTGMFSVPSDMERMKRFRVIVSTCVSSSFASGIGMPRGHFSHIFVDEAGQATEPEAALAIKLLGDEKTNFVLGGDPKQLGPIIRSPVAMKMGLETSFLERLMGGEAYHLDTGRDYCVVKLTKNFRSHRSILKFPNEKFYAAELEECADRRIIDNYLRSSYLPSPDFPIVFHAVSGKDAREASSPSFFNIDEVQQIRTYIRQLKDDRRFRTTDNDIGIIAPYHAQVLKIRAALRTMAEGVKVGSVEEFQGQERRVIIISTVRSSKEFVEYDLRHTLGFVANPRRFNVAVTRAKALLIIVGDPQVLSLDPLWRSFLNYIHLNGGWTGPAITWDPNEEVNEDGGYDAAVREKAGVDMNEFTRRMGEMTMNSVDETEDADGLEGIETQSRSKQVSLSQPTSTVELAKTPLWRIRVESLSEDERIKLSYKRAKSLALHYRLTAEDVSNENERHWKFHSDLIFGLDSSVFILLSIHYNLCLGTITKYLPNRPDLQPIVDKLLSFEWNGQYCLTEVGHGVNVINMETRATLLDDGTFDLHTPSELGAKYMPPTSPSGYPCIAVVHARLFVEGEDRGPKVFLVKLHDGFEMEHGVVSKVLPPRGGSRTVRHCLTYFNHVRLPASALLSGLEKPANIRHEFFNNMSRVITGTLVMGTAGVSAMRIASYIAGKYSIRRHVVDSATRLPRSIISFSTQYTPILSAIAQAIVLRRFCDDCYNMFTQKADPPMKHFIAAIAKTTIQRSAQATILEVSDRCGAQGLAEANQMSSLHADMRGLAIAEGDLLVISIRFAMDLLRGRIVVPPYVYPHSLLAKHEKSMISSLRQSLSKHTNPRSELAEASLLPHCQALIEAIGARMAFESAQRHIDGDIVNLFVASQFKKDPAWYALNEGLDGMTQTQMEVDVAKKLLPRISDLLEMLEVEPYIVAPIVSNEEWIRYVDGLPGYGQPASTISGAKHQSRVTFSRYSSALEESESDKNDVVVEGVFDFKCIEPDTASSGVRTNAVIKTSNQLCKATLIEVKLSSDHKPFGSSPCFTIEKAHTLSSRRISYYNPIEMTISFQQRFVGRYQDRIEMIFEDATFNKRFVITKPLRAIVGDQDLHTELAPKQAYKPRQAVLRPPVRDVIPGIKPPAQTSIKYVAPLPKAEIPQYLKNILDGPEKSSAKIADRIRKIVLPDRLGVDSYGRFFKLLLWIEEFKMEYVNTQDLARYDIMDAKLMRHNQYYYLEVPGLAEKRPSVLMGDRILVQEQGSLDGRWYEGHVHVVRQHEVGLRFHSTFDRYAAGRRFNVRFKLNRTPIKRQHQAMDSLFTEERILFPDLRHLHELQQRMQARISLNPFNPLIARNEPQMQAIHAMLAMPPGSLPLVIFGPPGTGKTITIIEGIKQILSTNRSACILACAPSNSAADLIAIRLMDFLQPDEMFRFYAPSRMREQVPHKLLPYAYLSSDGHFTIPPLSRVRRFRIIISTSISSSFTAGIGMARSHFTHIFLDEAGQATEPEAFVSIKMMANSNTNVVLSGDPKQLGPVIRSGVARSLGLEESYLERLMQREAYDFKNGARSMSVFKLTKNFRSHEAILRFPNDRFYDGELTPHGNAQLINSYLNSSYLPSSSFPIVFHSVSGKDDREASSPSFFNIDEVIQIKSYIRKLKEDRRYRTADADIGVIAPYHAQVVKIRNSLRNLADDVKVGSVEEFQGQERKVIIISTVRSSKEFIEYDLLHTLGFVANPRRFNVAVTRAQALLIIVGDAQVLSLDPLWRSFLNYIYLSGGWTGPGITWDPKEPVNEGGGYDQVIRKAAGFDMNEFSKRMEEATMAGVEDLDANVDRPWRDVE
ncbi:hypothetical protein CVT24_004675 [Panaeolus cyanescens]|uniref:RNA helicase n=1 Tax=Panaeolus cyanescens TaxID=181874 RepID=A0A409W1A3_9AGAR|nr:hypothetical protein CVT24_004675 [Panaeolus cyanescens]